MLLFVYGTLCRDEENHGEMLGTRFIEAARTEPLYSLVDMGGYPALLEQGHTAIDGEVYEVPAELLAQLDAFEEVPTLYERKPVQLQHRSAVDGYVMRRELAANAPIIHSGSWRSWRARDPA
jgi:gamma-glutamylcyclotransferase (GGCT)/AIG2-like uncharacterized protein YtfP